MGLIHIYCGDGKGKTTAGIGLCVRAAGYGFRVLICQFMKDNSSNERKSLSSMKNVTLLEGPYQEKFSFQMTPEEKAEKKIFCETQLQTATQKAEEENYDVLFLDEILYAIQVGLMDENLLLAFLRNKPEKLEVILTGQNPSPELISLADYVSEVKKIKHPYDQGTLARDGIEK